MAPKKEKKFKPKAVKAQKIQTKSSVEWKPIGFILVITAVVFSGVLGHDFVNWDDPQNLTENPHLNGFTWENIQKIFTTTVIGNYNPLPIFMFAIEKAIFGLNPGVFHFNNLLLHLACVFFVYSIMRAMNLSIWAAALGALFFGIHPMRVESVAWITERKDVLFGVFYLAAMLTYILWIQRPEERKKWYLVTLGLFFVSLFAKIQAVALPLSMLALDYYFKRPLHFKLILEKIPFFLLSLIIGLLGIYFLGRDGSLQDETKYSILERLLTGTYSYCVYLIKWILPYQMSPLYPYTLELPSAAYISPLGVLAVLALFFYAFKKEYRSLVFGLAFFTFNIMFLLQILGAGQGFLADRFTYIAYFGLFFIAAHYFEMVKTKYPSKKNLIFGTTGAYLILLVVMTFLQVKIWKNGETLWSHASRQFPNSDTPYQNLGKYYQTQNKIDKAIENFTLAISTARKPEVSYNSRGKVYFDQGKLDLALADFTASINEGAQISEIFINRGATYARMQRYQEALPDFNKGLELDPKNKQGYLMRSLLYYTNGNFEAAFKDMSEVLKIDPKDSNAWYEAGLNLHALGRYQESLEHFNQAIQLNPNQHLFYTERAKVQQVLGNTAAANADLERAKQLGGGTN